MRTSYCPHCGNPIETNSTCCASNPEPKPLNYDKEIALVRSLTVRERYETATALLEKLITEFPEDLRSYIALVRIATKNYTVYASPAISDSIRVALQMSNGVSLEEFDADYADYIKRSLQYFESEKKKSEQEKPLYEIMGTTLVRYTGHEPYVIIPEGCEKILAKAFRENQELLDIELPDGLLTIGNYAFNGCNSLTRLITPDSLTDIAPFAFCNCKSLTKLVIGGGVRSIGRYAFSQCGALEEITFNGTKAEWCSIRKGQSWNEGLAASSVHCTDGDQGL